MAEAKLNFDESELDRESSLYDLYSRLYEGMKEANTVDPPDFSNPPLTGEGELDADAIREAMSGYSTILTKNSAYMMANSIISTLSGGGGGGGSGGTGFVSRSGDSMAGMLGALYGFQAGYAGKLIFDTTVNAAEKKIAHVYGSLTVDDDVSVQGRLNLSESGINISGVDAIYVNDNCLNIEYGNIKITGDMEVDGAFLLGDVIINEAGIFWGEYEFYHNGNSNRSDVDWSMRDGHVYGTLQVDGNAVFGGFLKAVNGFSLGAEEESLFYSSEKNGKYFLQLATDLSLWTGHGIKFDDKYIIRARGGADNIISFSAPGMVINLGDSDGETATQRIALQTDIYNYNSAYRIISRYGDGNFPNSLSAGCGNSGPTVLQTYYRDGNDCGVTFQKRIRFYSSAGPSLRAGDIETLTFEAPYIHIDNDLKKTDYIESCISYKQTGSLFKDQSLPWSASLTFDTKAEFIVFGKPTEAKSFSIISEKYKTRLLENSLFFGDGIFLEGVTDGILHSGNAYFSEGLSSRKFASGFAGYGWAILPDKTYGTISATFDELTVRKKMRVYELEVQKSTVTNGSLWVSDSCSGDLVEEII
jgi:hypothetical protein